MKRDEKGAAKIPYHTPELRTYAEVRALAESKNSMVGSSDGAYGNLLKTG
ncbi:MAG: hypothetical protein ACE5HV_12595 [Acidobacteriota bacterium]